MGLLIDGDVGLRATEVGEWAKQKHEFLRRYLDISSAARKKFLNGRSRSATFIDLFCGPGRARIKETGEWIDGGAIAAWKISQAGGTAFSEIFVADIDDVSRAATAERLKRLGTPVRKLPGSAVAGFPVKVYSPLKTAAGHQEFAAWLRPIAPGRSHQSRNECRRAEPNHGHNPASS